MEIKKQNVVIEENNNIKTDIDTLEKVFARTLQVDKLTFRLKQGLKGKELFMLVNTFGFNIDSFDAITEGLDANSKSISKIYKNMFNNFGENYETALSFLEFSINGKDFIPLIINNVCQVEDIETKVSIMYQLFNFIYEAAMFFMQIS